MRGDDHIVSNLVFSITFAIGAPMMFGQLMVYRSRLNRALREKARRAEDERRREGESAALEERTRIAGELHDVVAHALSAMTVQASAARRLSERDPALARDAFATVEHTGREALAELRRLLGVLRKEDEELALAPQPSLTHIDSLARRARAAGLPVELTVSGAVRALPAGVDLTAYRLVQEALGGARDTGHAGRAEVRIAYGDEDGPGRRRRRRRRRTGRRLLGMRERVAVYGGELASAPVPERRLARQRAAAAGGRAVSGLLHRIAPRTIDRAAVRRVRGAGRRRRHVAAPPTTTRRSQRSPPRALVLLPLLRRRAPVAAILHLVRRR